MKKRYCPMCDEMVVGDPCPECGADTDRWPPDADPLEPAVYRGRERSEHERESQTSIMRDLKR